MKTNNLKFRHGANLGDIIYSLWAVRQGFRKYEMKVDYFQWLNRAAHYYNEAQHPTKDDKGQMVSVNQKMFDMVKPLIECLPFINSFNEWKGESCINLDRIREINVGMPNGAIQKWFTFAYPDLQCDISEKVFSYNDLGYSEDETLLFMDKVSDAIIVNRTSRYRNPLISYGFLSVATQKIYFVGTMEEFADFSDEVVNSVYLPVDDFKMLAAYIAHCKVFVGNQSFCYSLAEAMKTPRILEVCQFAPNVIPTGPNGYDFYNQQSLEYLVTTLTG